MPYSKKGGPDHLKKIILESFHKTLKPAINKYLKFIYLKNLALFLHQ